MRQLFEATISEPLLDGAAAAAREVFEGPASGVAGDDTSFAILHALYRLTVNLAEPAPLLLALDDLQWCDEPSLRWLNYLVRRLDGLAITVLCGVRPFEHHAHAHLLAELTGDPLALTLHPEPLSEAATAELLDDGADAAFTHACHDATGGNPLLLVELTKTLRAEGVPPDAAHVATVEEIAPRAVVARRAGADRPVEPDAAAVARATAVLGDVAALRSVAELAGLDDGAAVAAAGELVAAEVFADQAAMTFVHPLIRAAVYRGHPRARAFARARARRAAAARSRRRRGNGRHPARPRAAARRGVGGRRARAGGASRSARGRARERRVVPDPRAGRAAARRAPGPTCWRRWAASENLLHATQSEAHLREALELAADPITRGTAALQLAGTLC